MADLTTLAAVKLWLGLSGTDEDALLQSLITAASGTIQSYLGRDLLVGARLETRNGLGGTALVVAHRPLVSVESLQVDQITIPPASGAAGGYLFSDTTIRLTGGWRFGAGVGNVRIAYTAGYATVPPEIAQACTELVALKYKEREHLGVSGKSLAGEHISFTPATLTPAIRAAIDGYRQVVPL